MIIDRKLKVISISAVIIALVIVGAYLAVHAFQGKQGVYSYVVEYDETELFPDEYEIIGTRIEPTDALQIYSDKELTEKISTANSQAIKDGGDPAKINVDTVNFGYSARMKEVYASVPDYLIYAEIAEPIIFDVTELFEAERGEIVEKQVYIDGKLAYTVRSCKGEPEENGFAYMAILIKPEAGQEFSVEGCFREGNGVTTSLFDTKVNNIIPDRAVKEGKMYYASTDVKKCENLLGIKADDFDDNCALFCLIINDLKDNNTVSDQLPKDPFYFVGDTLIVKLPVGGTKAIDPNDYVAK